MQSINLGTPNQGNGDTLRDAFLKVNANFARPTLPVHTSEPADPVTGEFGIAVEWPSAGEHIVVYYNNTWNIIHTF